jgi:hypothetical protein
VQTQSSFGRADVFRSALDTLVRLGLGTSGKGVLHDSDFRETALETLQERLRTTLICCRDVSEHYSMLEGPYRLKRRLLVLSALTLASQRLSTSCRRILRRKHPRLPVSLSGQVAMLMAAGSLGFCQGMLRAAVNCAPTQAARRLDDATVSIAIWFLGEAETLVKRLDQFGDLIEIQSRSWTRLEVLRGTTFCDDSFASQVRSKVLWACPTLVSKLILLSTLRDNNTGAYRHPLFTGNRPPAAVHEALARIHGEICEELLNLRFPELVYELELYANETQAGRRGFLRTWKRIPAYRMARPAALDQFTSSLFELTLDFAVAALDSRS